MSTACALPIEEVLAPEGVAGIVPPLPAIGRSREGATFWPAGWGAGTSTSA
ncbi:MAG TPA: hypothetical protein VHR45_19070 [Thermoanaerobaculia bacterium]|nr:hypothetical protein [Thermoanaerobaculia bacterium]